MSCVDVPVQFWNGLFMKFVGGTSLYDDVGDHFFTLSPSLLDDYVIMRRGSCSSRWHLSEQSGERAPSMPIVNPTTFGEASIFATRLGSSGRP